MIIQNATYSIIYPKANNIRRDLFNLEDELEGIFVKPFALLPIPDEAPEEIPRIQATSKYGHSNLSVSLNTAQITVNFDENYAKNKDKCLEYITNRIYKIFNAIKTKVSDKCLFSGLTLNILFDDLKDENPIDIITNNLYKAKSDLKPYDINNKVTYVISEKYYINITCFNVRTYSGISNMEVNSLVNMKENSHILGVTLDINDRYAFNYKNGYETTASEIENIINISDSVLTEKINKYIKEGGVNF